MSYLRIIPKYLEDRNDLIRANLLTRILERVEKNFETFDSRIIELENLNNMEHAFSSSTEDFAFF